MPFTYVARGCGAEVSGKFHQVRTAGTQKSALAHGSSFALNLSCSAVYEPRTYF